MSHSPASTSAARVAAIRQATDALAEALIEALGTIPDPAPPDGEWLGYRDAGERLGVSYSMVRKLVREGRLPSARVGRRRVIARIDLEAYMGAGGGR